MATTTKRALGIWGQKYSSAQLSVVLREHREDFMDMCRRITCDEDGAARLFQMVENHLSSNKDRSARPSSLADELRKTISLRVKLNKSPELHIDETQEVDDQDPDSKDEVNLIQLLAEIHRASLTQGSLKRRT